MKWRGRLVRALENAGVGCKYNATRACSIIKGRKSLSRSIIFQDPLY
jgi:hypothetical protein